MEIRTVDIGSLNKRITFKRLEHAEDDMGLYNQELHEICTVWGSFWPIRGQERYEAFRAESDAKFKCYVRYSAKTKDINAEDFVELNGTQYQITDVMDIEGQHKLIEIYCTNQINREVKADV